MWWIVVFLVGIAVVHYNSLQRICAYGLWERWSKGYKTAIRQ